MLLVTWGGLSLFDSWFDAATCSGCFYTGLCAVWGRWNLHGNIFDWDFVWNWKIFKSRQTGVGGAGLTPHWHSRGFVLKGLILSLLVNPLNDWHRRCTVCLMHKAETVKTRPPTACTNRLKVCFSPGPGPVCPAQVYRHSPAAGVNAIHLRVTEESHQSAKCPQTGLGAS